MSFIAQYLGCGEGVKTNWTNCGVRRSRGLPCQYAQEPGPHVYCLRIERKSGFVFCARIVRRSGGRWPYCVYHWEIDPRYGWDWNNQQLAFQTPEGTMAALRCKIYETRPRQSEQGEPYDFTDGPLNTDDMVDLWNGLQGLRPGRRGLGGCRKRR